MTHAGKMLAVTKLTMGATKTTCIVRTSTRKVIVPGKTKAKLFLSQSAL